MQSFITENGVKVYRYGNPIVSGAVSAELIQDELTHDLNLHFDQNKAIITFDLEENDEVYGLGGNLGGINKRGKLYESYCNDAPDHTEEKTNLYSAHNFFIISGSVNKGYFIDFPSRILYDIGFTHKDTFSMEIFGHDFDLYEIDGGSLQKICENFLYTIGRAYIPPKWGFGYFQSRWGYRDQQEIREVKNNFDFYDIPLEGIFLDLDYMEDYKDFTISEVRFPDFSNLVTEFKKEGLRLIPIIDAGVKIEKDYEIYEQGVENDYFCLDENDTPYVAAVWPGKVHFPDFLNEETQKWFGYKYKYLTDMGIEGFWNDMNEPAIFYDEDSLQQAIDKASACQGKNLDAHTFFDLKDKFSELLNNSRYYQKFYHQMNGEKVRNDQVHNLYGSLMTKSANIGLSQILENNRFLLVSRASDIGMHRYGGIWTGDNSSWWSHLDLNIKMMPSLNMCGFYFCGADVGGFGDDCTGELLIRWLQFGVFTPFLRNHSAIDTRAQEPYAFQSEVTDISKSIIESRYSLLPYLYSEYMKSVTNYRMLFKPLAFEYRNVYAKQAEDQLFFSDQLMLAPITRPNHTGRYVYLPETMVEVNFQTDDIDLQIKQAGIDYLDYQLDDFKFYLRPNSIVPYVSPCRNVDSLDKTEVKFMAFVDEEAEYSLYDDDGVTFGFDREESYSTNIKITNDLGEFSVIVDNDNPEICELSIVIVDSNGNMQKKKVEL